MTSLVLEMDQLYDYSNDNELYPSSSSSMNLPGDNMIPGQITTLATERNLGCSSLGSFAAAFHDDSNSYNLGANSNHTASSCNSNCSLSILSSSSSPPPHMNMLRRAVTTSAAPVTTVASRSRVEQQQQRQRQYPSFNRIDVLDNEDDDDAAATAALIMTTSMTSLERAESAPGAYCARGRPIGIHHDSRTYNNNNNNNNNGTNNPRPAPQAQAQAAAATTSQSQQQSRPASSRPRLSQDDRMSTKSFEWWLRSLQDDDLVGGDFSPPSSEHEQPQQAQAPNQAHHPPRHHHHHQQQQQQQQQRRISFSHQELIDAVVRRCSRRNLTMDIIDESFDSIPPELRPSPQEEELAANNIDTNTQRKRKKKLLSKKRIIRKVGKLIDSF